MGSGTTYTSRRARPRRTVEMPLSDCVFALGLAAREGNWNPVAQWHKGSRYTFEITATTDHGWHNLIGKVFSRESFNVFDAMRRIWRVGLDKDSEFAIPEPLAYVPSLRLLLQEKAIGKHAKEVFLAGSPAERAEAAERW